jgi:hypothetical protein
MYVPSTLMLKWVYRLSAYRYVYFLQIILINTIVDQMQVNVFYVVIMQYIEIKCKESFTCAELKTTT